MFFYYLFVVVYTKCALRSAGKREVWQSVWPGFESQVWISFNIIFPCMFVCRLSKVVHHTPSLSNVHASWEIRSRAWISRTRCALVNASAYYSKRSNGPRVFGPDYSKLYLHFGDFHPPWFAIFFFIFFSIVILFSLLF